MTLKRLALLALSLAALLWRAPLNAATLYSQPTDYATHWASQNDTNSFGSFAVVYDNFTLGSASAITTVQFVGAYFNPSSPGAIAAFNLQIYADASGTPGTSLYSIDVAGNAGESFLQDDNLGSPAYLYTMNTDFTALAGVQYWLSVQPTLGFPPQWGWETGTGGDGGSYQVFFESGAHNPGDLAFTLSGDPVTATPEPFSLALAASGLALVVLARRKRSA